jgi:hypothetical protein
MVTVLTIIAEFFPVAQFWSIDNTAAPNQLQFDVICSGSLKK